MDKKQTSTHQGDFLETRSSDSKLSEETENDENFQNSKRAREIMSGMSQSNIQMPIKKIKIESYDIFYKNKVRKTYKSILEVDENIEKDGISNQKLENKEELGNNVINKECNLKANEKNH